MSIFSSSCSLLLLVMMFTAPLIYQASSAPCNAQDQKALLAIKAAFHGVPFFSTWLPGTDCCNFQWKGVDCDSNNVRVTGITIQDDPAIVGSIPPAIGDLPFVDNILLQNLPHLSGPIPSSITNLKLMNFLLISKTNLSGPVPAFLSQLTTLTFFSLSHNRLSGPIPPSLSNLKNVGALDLSHNQLSGSIPDSFGTFEKIQPGTLYLSHNRLSGPIPRSLGRPEWPIIDISRNRLTGDASFLFGSEKGTLEMDLSKNRLSFDLSRVTFPLNLTKLVLSNNQIYGSIPAQINQVTNYGLETLDLSNNRLCGEIPPGVVTSKFGPSSYAGNQCLCGPPLPACK